MSVREVARCGVAALALTGLGPALVGWALWSLLGEALFDVGALVVLVAAVLLAAALAADLATNGRGR